MENVRIQDDLYMYVNKETLDNLVIPDVYRAFPEAKKALCIDYRASFFI